MRSGEVADEAPVKDGLGEPVAELLRPGKAGSVRHEVAHGLSGLIVEVRPMSKV